ncbi:hypothetical protein T4B_7243 [Trichinella pseudospiralis]|uniref:Secreted protein n=1 Tax=Trichinella pseudospiralis TaxID=6337 RepID=A0A0V1ISU5_TRIPS|nr:hypothetical protein T4E_11749 [Trichinella pseudospiralis]KRZ25851.1 hypothetical protein T4B_7243 [Trichinella pseudospiralis]
MRTVFWALSRKALEILFFMNLCLMFCESKDDGCGEQAVSLMTETSSLTATHVNLAFHSLKQCWSLACPAMTSTCSKLEVKLKNLLDESINFQLWLKTDDDSRPPPELFEQQPVINDCGQSRSSLRTSNSIGFFCA